MNNVEYALNAGGWFIAGCVTASIYWRFYIHKLLRSRGLPKEQPLLIFVAFVTVALMASSLMFSEAGRVKLNDFIRCQATVQQSNVNSLNDSRSSQVILAQNDEDFFKSLKKLFQEPPGTPHVQSDFFKAIDDHIAADKTRVTQLRNDPLKPVTTCHKDSTKGALK